MKDISVPVHHTNQVDPICGMPVNGSSVIAEAVYIGVRYFFCSEECYQIFVHTAVQCITELAHGGDNIGHRCPSQRSGESDSDIRDHAESPTLV